MKISDMEVGAEYAVIIGRSIPGNQENRIRYAVRMEAVDLAVFIDQKISGGAGTREVRAVEMKAVEDAPSDGAGGRYPAMAAGETRKVEARLVLGPWKPWAKLREDLEREYAELGEKNDRGSRVGAWVMENLLGIEPTPHPRFDDAYIEIHPIAGGDLVGGVMIEISEEHVIRLDEQRATSEAALNRAEG